MNTRENTSDKLDQYTVADLPRAGLRLAVAGPTISAQELVSARVHVQEAAAALVVLVVRLLPVVVSN